MAVTTSFPQDEVLGRAIVEFASNGKYLDIDLSAHVQRDAVRKAHKLVTENKSEAEIDIRAISRDVAHHVDSWIKHADSLQKDIDQSKLLGQAIIRNAENTFEVEKAFEDSNVHAEFLRKEINYNDILLAAIKNIKSINDDIDAAEQKAAEQETMASIKLISEALNAIRSLPNYHRVRAYTLLETKALRIGASLSKDLDSQWNSLVQVHTNQHQLVIQEELQGQSYNLKTTLLAMKRLGQLEQKAQVFKDRLMTIIINPRVDRDVVGQSLCIATDEDSIHIGPEKANSSIDALLFDLEKTISFVAGRLPELSAQLSQAILPDLCQQIRKRWLDPIIPSRIHDMDPLKQAVNKVQWFIERLKGVQWTQTKDLQEWVADCARLWLTKRKETDLVKVRSHLALGLVNQKTIYKQEDTEVFSVAENGVDDDAWNDGWSDDGETAAERAESGHHPELEVKDGEDDGEDTDAWGWNDDDPTAEEIRGEGEGEDAPASIQPQTSPRPTGRKSTQKMTALTLKWRYLISTMPEGVLEVVVTTIEDALSLLQQEHAQNPVAPAAMGMFALPALVLAMYRSISPYYYSSAEGGNMFLYNDALWLAEQLSNISKNWSSRPDMTPRASGKVRFDREIEVLEKLGKRAYAKEIATQRVIIKDLLRGDQPFLLEEGLNIEDDEAAIDNVISHIRATSKIWETILARQNWAQAVGTLLATIANKIITDVLEISGLEADASYNIAKLIARVVILESIFTSEPVTEAGEFAGLKMQASEYVGNSWFKLQYLSEILQSNLDGLRFLWFEGEASMFYTAAEMIDLIELSFAESSRREEITRRIKHNPRPRPDLY